MVSYHHHQTRIEYIKVLHDAIAQNFISIGERKEIR